MNRSIVLAFLFSYLFTVSCTRQSPQEQTKTIPVKTGKHLASRADILKIDVARSKIEWTASEMWGAKKRRGKISFKDGFISIINTEIINGHFTVAMASMEITDIPPHEKIARKNLIEHLKSNDFFNVETYPVATLTFTQVQQLTTDSFKISADMTIREITKSISFLAKRKNNTFSAHVKFNRFDWNIAYQGSWAARTLIDKTIELNISIKLQH